VFNAACGERVSLNTVLEMISELSGVELDPDYQPGRRGEVRHSQADIGKAREVFGYSASIDFAEGLRRTFEHTVAARGAGSAPSPA
jgi:nucleoside-diphosphate-sugar epimerase